MIGPIRDFNYQPAGLRSDTCHLSIRTFFDDREKAHEIVFAHKRMK